MNSRLTPAEPFPEDLTALDDIEVQVLHSRVQRQLDYEYAYEFEADPETEFRHAELSEEFRRRNVRASTWRPLLHDLVSGTVQTPGSGSTGEYVRIPALDPAAFEELATDLASHSIASDFMTSFELLLAGRIQRIERAFKDQDREELITALMSLQASAAMAGAAQLQISATRALADASVKTTLPGPLVRKLQKQADRFGVAFADFRQRRFSVAA